MPDPAFMFIFCLFLQAAGAITAKEPSFLKDHLDSLASEYSQAGQNWDVNSEAGTRGLVQHQLGRHVRTFYTYLKVLHSVLWLLVLLGAGSALAFFLLGGAGDITVAVWVFVFIFFAFGVLSSVPGLFSLFLSVLLAVAVPK